MSVPMAPISVQLRDVTAKLPMMKPISKQQPAYFVAKSAPKEKAAVMLDVTVLRADNQQ